MNKLKFIKTVSIIITILVLISLAIGLSIVFYESKKTDEDKGEESKEIYNIKYDKIPNPIKYNINTTLVINDKISKESTISTNKVYKIDKDDEFYPDKSLAEDLSDTLDLEFKSNNTDIYIYSKQDYSVYLEYSKEQNSITIYYNIEISDKTDFEIETVKTIAKKALQDMNLFPWESENDYFISFRYYETALYNFYETTEKENASLVGIVFSSKIAEVPVIASRINSGEIEVLLDTSGNIKRIEYVYRPIQEKEYSTYPAISRQSALEQIPYGKAELIKIFEAVEPTTLNLELEIIAYRITFDEQEYLQPTYAFQGTDNHNQLITVLTPAIEDLYLITPD